MASEVLLPAPGPDCPQGCGPAQVVPILVNEPLTGFSQEPMAGSDDARKVLKPYGAVSRRSRVGAWTKGWRGPVERPGPG